MEKTIFLVGYMGSGKTTLGRPLAGRLGRRFVDLDEEVERRCGMTVREIFASRGEAWFRCREREALRDLAACGEPLVVSCGGGTPLAPDNMALMNRVGVTVWLRAGAPRIAARILLPEQRRKRPQFDGLTDAQVLAAISRGLRERKPYYAAAAVTFGSTWLESEDQIARSAARLAATLGF